MTRISVALCTYNGARFLREQLRSIVEQSVRPGQIVVCDDGSTDETLMIASDYPCEIHTTKTRLGTAANFDRAISLCEGEMIFLADQDDVWHPDKVARILERDAECTFSDARLIHESGSPTGRTLWQHLGFRPGSTSLFDTLANTNVVTGATMAFRSRLKKIIQPIPADQPHDWWIALLAAATGSLAPIAETLIDYRLHERQQSGAGPEVGSMNTWLNASMQTGPRAFEQRAQRLRAVRDRLMQHGVAIDLDARIEHLQTRALMHGVRRPLLVARELMTGRYFRYSRHVLSAAKDLFGVASNH
jgi:glycosyltransferase involved in cell wall biosynthesis